MSRIGSIKQRYEQIRQEQLDAVVDSFRMRDSDLAARGGGLLGFSGLMMASDLVFLYAGKAPAQALADVALAAAFVLASGSWFAYRSLAIAANYTKDATALAFLERWENHLLRRGRLQRVGALLTAIGTLMFLLAMAANRWFPATAPS
jgi:hypothetical protein